MYIDMHVAYVLYVPRGHILEAARQKLLKLNVSSMQACLASAAEAGLKDAVLQTVRLSLHVWRRSV